MSKFLKYLKEYYYFLIIHLGFTAVVDLWLTSTITDYNDNAQLVTSIFLIPFSSKLGKIISNYKIDYCK